ncbi:hypothetical protein [Paludibacterium yongneupense]|uniref:hypothetical protein n=1 Tax=Paludibacterium yongneupense TaxID=400061 RepID=UPI0012EC803E|nr:hypothetical protein [Paludibacterium yongneupense]
MKKRNGQPEIWMPITYVRGEYRLDGRYKIESGMITVSCANGTKMTQAGGTPPDSLARLILSEMVDASAEG